MGKKGRATTLLYYCVCSEQRLLTQPKAAFGAPGASCFREADFPFQKVACKGLMGLGNRTFWGPIFHRSDSKKENRKVAGCLLYE